MSRIRVIGGVGDLARDLSTIRRQAGGHMQRKCNEGARAGNMLAKGFAKESAGEHGKHYHKAFTWEPSRGFRGASTSIYAAEYGPQIDRKQGGMSFEFGSRNQPPHLDLARSADVIGPSFGQEVGQMADGWFWP